MVSGRQHESPNLSERTVVVIGAGVSGVALAVNLRRRGVTDFVVLEMSDGIGGTWWDNGYPGAEVDVTSELYSFSFAPHVFTRTHATQDEIRRYIENVVAERRLERHFVLHAKVESVEWSDHDNRYTVSAADGRQWRAEFVVSAVGQLNNPRYPDWPGLADFRGEMFHTARWDHDVQLDGKRVAIVGTGSTSAQAVPQVAEQADHLFLFQRQPGWVVPKLDRDYRVSEVARLRRRMWLLKLRRATAFVRLERMRGVARAGTRSNRKMQRLAEAYLQTAVTDPELRALLTPDYPFFGKRPVLTQYYYPALARPNVTLVPRAVTQVTETGVVDSTGQHTPVDVIVMATGFQPSRFLSTLRVVGRKGVRLSDVWDAEPKSLLGMMAVGFPNFFVTYGPNTNGGTVIFTLERQAEWISRSISAALRSDVALDCRPAIVNKLDHIIVHRNRGFVWSTTKNYYTSATGRIVTQWPFSQTLYWVLLRVLGVRIACTRTPLRRSQPIDRSAVVEPVTDVPLTQESELFIR